MIKNFIYYFLQFYVKLALHFYYKRYQCEDVENIPNGPVLFVSNHQNAFLDALVITCATKKSPYYLARASIFKKKLVSQILNVIRLIPIYRIRDGFGNVKRNDQLFAASAALLSSGGSLLIFPEGNHDNRHLLRPLQKGAARIALETEGINNIEVALSIIPVGIHYGNYDGVGSSVLVNIGDPLLVKDFIKGYKKEPAAAIQNLTREIGNKIRPLILDMGPEISYNEIWSTWSPIRSHDKNLFVRLCQDQQIIENIRNDKNGHLNESTQSKYEGIIKMFHYPFYILTKINLFIPDQFISYYVNNKLKEPMFEGSMRFGLWAFPGMAAFFVQSIIIYLLSNGILFALLYFILSLLVARLAIITKPDN